MILMREKLCVLSHDRSNNLSNSSPVKHIVQSDSGTVFNFCNLCISGPSLVTRRELVLTS
jgi:hypothetical protein